MGTTQRGLRVFLAGAAAILATVSSVTVSVAGPPAGAAAAILPAPATAGSRAAPLSSAPQRILSLSASATQMLYAIGAGHQVVGVDKYSTYPANAPRTKFTGYESSAEDYLYLRPDLVIFAFNSGTLIQQLKLLHIRALLLPPATSFAAVYGQLQELAAVTGHPSGASRVKSAIEGDLSAAVREADHAGQGDSYYVEVDPTLYTATSHTFIGAEFSLFGMRNIADAAGRTTNYPQISAEYIVKQNPDYVFLADTVCCGQSPATFAGRPGFRALRAVVLHHVVGVNDSVASQWGPHTIETFVSLLARALHP